MRSQRRTATSEMRCVFPLKAEVKPPLLKLFYTRLVLFPLTRFSHANHTPERLCFLFCIKPTNYTREAVVVPPCEAAVFVFLCVCSLRPFRGCWFCYCCCCLSTFIIMDIDAVVAVAIACFRRRHHEGGSSMVSPPMTQFSRPFREMWRHRQF